MTTTFKQQAAFIGGLALYGVAYLTAMAIGQVVANTHLILTTLEDLIMELATVTEITECVITPDYVEVEDNAVDTGVECDQPCVALTPVHDALTVRKLRTMAIERGIPIRLNGKVMNKQQLVEVLLNSPDYDDDYDYDYDCDGTPPENYYTKADREYRELHR